MLQGIVTTTRLLFRHPLAFNSTPTTASESTNGGRISATQCPPRSKFTSTQLPPPFPGKDHTMYDTCATCYEQSAFKSLFHQLVPVDPSHVTRFVNCQRAQPQPTSQVVLTVAKMGKTFTTLPESKSRLRAHHFSRFEGEFSLGSFPKHFKAKRTAGMLMCRF